MAYQPVDIGSAPNDGTGDPIRDAFDKVNDNFVEVYAGLTGLLDFKGSTDCSGNPNYPAASKGDFYLVSVAGKIGGASGVVVEVGDSYFATADNAGGNQATVGTSWTVLQGNITAYLPLSGGTLTGDLIVPAEAYDATNWNGSNEVPTKNDVRDKIEDILDGVTFTGDIIVPDEAYDATAWNASLEVPTKNAVRDKIESMSGAFVAASTTEVLTGTDSAKGGTPDSIAALWEQGADVSSAGTTSLGEGGYFNITGTTTITDIDFATDKAGRKAWVKFVGILTLTHNASTLILPTGANITTAAGDTACFVSEGSDVVRCVSYQRANGSGLIGYEAGPAGTVPTVASLTWLNQGTSTAADGVGALVLTPQLNGAVHSLVAAVPAAPFDIYCRVDMRMNSSAAVTAALDNAAGVVLRDSSDGEVVTFQVGYQRTTAGVYQPNLVINRWTASGGTYSATPFFRQNHKVAQWIRLNVTATTVTFYVSDDGKNWVQITTETIATFIDAVTHYGVFAYGSSNATELQAPFTYFSTTAPA